ncbi:hypothetical protein COW94_03550 [Candidatus Peregrinibacteria bacterium CG22_combo_CG10-13_8_21_14_all_44_10]|nr:MAG: hypothetical protein AUK45_04600 [Candidatus Peregrinibacteria bacterium CG2_30_44_17]PIP66091.1 MAG: hypothetical protein COW94_03550 [Candidatus Peregrinibacteria bacterium CG22_combo_CG10-13_8_21_14_all_44_10]PIS04352.1 MAG: hypothetical protein COT83_01065 [Candidatus Peregrinibacteria bacterium CG10_big_fil_rev_8_21_14_0_10_44_7]PIX80364.1 MAG: hypothetical protein COZ35_01005 [Candidatus Peregrinibacteria bacterium CG_4_10_14_3_um_filter_44_21]PJB89412.1 MAG: hypothetical protein 
MPTKKTAPATQARPVNIEFNVGEFETMQDFIKYASSVKRLILYNFIAGTARGLGFIIGATAFLALAGYILSQYLVNIPFVGEIFTSIDQWFKQNLDSYN